MRASFLANAQLTRGIVGHAVIQRTVPPSLSIFSSSVEWIEEEECSHCSAKGSLIAAVLLPQECTILVSTILVLSKGLTKTCSLFLTQWVQTIKMAPNCFILTISPHLCGIMSHFILSPRFRSSIMNSTGHLYPLLLTLLLQGKTEEMT